MKIRFITNGLVCETRCPFDTHKNEAFVTRVASADCKACKFFLKINNGKGILTCSHPRKKTPPDTGGRR